MNQDIDVIALAGRRIDAADAETTRFPLDAADAVRDRLRDLMAGTSARFFVSSAACGADLVGLDIAGSLGLERHVVLPFGPARFRETSVTDRPGDWGPLYDRVLEEIGDANVEVVGRAEGEAAYLAANEAILSRAGALAPAPARVLAVIVWDGAPRGAGDVTAAFRRRAAERGMRTASVLTQETA